MLESSSNDEVGISNCFIKKHKAFLKLYSTYCQNYKTAYNTTEKLEKDYTLDKCIQKVRLKYGHCLKMATYLQLPVLRITKYHLLLQRYLKLLNKDSFAYAQVLEALNLMKQVNDQINREMPDLEFDEENNDETKQLLSTIDIKHLINLFGNVVKQTMLIIRKYASSTKIMHSISNEFLAFVPKTPSKNKYFTIVDYSQPKGDEMRQFTFKAKSVEEKQSWQSGILSCMLNQQQQKPSQSLKQSNLSDTHKKLSISIENNFAMPKTPVNKISSSSSSKSPFLPYSQGLSVSSHQLSTMGLTSVSYQNESMTGVGSSSTLKKKISGFKRLADFRYSLKSDSKKTKTLSLENKHESSNADTFIDDDEEEENNKNNISTTLRRLSMPLQSQTSRISKVLFQMDTNKSSKNANDSVLATPVGLFSKFRKEKPSKNQPITNKPESEIETEPIEENVRHTNMNMIYEQLNNSFFEITDTLEENILTHYEKILNEKYKKKVELIETLKKSSDYYVETINSSSSSSAEEGYYSSNHDSSSSTSASPCLVEFAHNQIDLESLHLNDTSTDTKSSYFSDLKSKLKLNGSFKGGSNTMKPSISSNLLNNFTSSLKRVNKLNSSFNSLNRANSSVRQQNVITYDLNDNNNNTLNNSRQHYKSMPKLVFGNTFTAKNINNKIKTIQIKLQDFMKKSTNNLSQNNENFDEDVNYDLTNSKKVANSNFNKPAITAAQNLSYRSYFVKNDLSVAVDESVNVKKLISKFECKRTKF